MKIPRLPTLCITLLILATGCPPTESQSPTPDVGFNVGEEDANVGEEDIVDDPSEPAEIVFPEAEFVILQGSPTRPEAQVLDGNGEVMEGVNIDWASADPSIIEVSSGGFALGIEIGTTELIATAGSLEERWPARVVGEAVASVELVPASATISIGWELPYMVNLRDQWNSTITDERHVEWSTTDTALATIDANGVVEAHAAGELEVIAVVEGIEARADLTILDVDVESIAITPSSPAPMERGSTLQLSVTAYGTGGEVLENQGAQWSSDDEDVATVDTLGRVHAVGVGQTTVTAAVGELEDTVDIEVYFLIHQVAAGGGFSCALAGAQILCWGANDRGQLGDGTFDDSADPVVVDYSGAVEALSLGEDHACLLDGDGEVWCWGANDDGQLGQSSGDESATPQPLGVSIDFEKISAGKDHTCALATGGQAYCWGANNSSQSGHAGASTHQPTAVAGGHTFQAVSAGGRHTCGIAANDNAYCWGANDRGQLGGSTSADQSSTPQFVDGGYSFGSISAGGDHTCGRSTSGPPVCWGANDRGQLGVGSTADQDIPLTLALQPGEGLTVIASGAEHACGLVSGGSPRCWGAHDDGRLGTTDNEDATAPQPTDGDHLFTRIAVGAAHACGRTADHQVLCWGADPAAGATPTVIDL